MELVAAVVDPRMDVDGKFKMQVDDDAEIELNCEYSSRIGSVGELTAQWSSTYFFITLVALARKLLLNFRSDFSQALLVKSNWEAYY